MTVPKPVKTILFALALLFALLSLPCAFVVSFLLGSLHPLFYFSCWAAGVSSVCLLLGGWAFGSRRVRLAAMLVLALVVAGCAALRLYRWAAHDRFAVVPSEPYDWWGQRPFLEGNGLPARVAPEEYRFRDGLPNLTAAYALYPVLAAAVQALCPREMYEAADEGTAPSATGSDAAYLFMLHPEWSHTDAILALKPSARQAEEAEKNGIRYEFTPVSRDAFIFFVNARNPVEGLTSGQIRDIYSGRTTSWQELGVPLRARLQPFQRNPDSGSQTMMERFMGDVPLMRPPKENVSGGMGDIINVVSDYRNHPGAIGYSFRYYAQELIRNRQIKVLAIDGVKPTPAAIRLGTYPLAGDAYLVTRGAPTGDVARLAAYLTSPEGRALVEDVGYIAPLPPPSTSQPPAVE